MIYYLNDIWSLYFHDPDDNDWSEKSYIFITTISSINEYIDIYLTYKNLFTKGMFFFIREHISPRWEDAYNKKGGAFSIKILKNNIEDKFFEIVSNLLGETLGINDKMSLNINGISISPKKNYYIVRVWLKDSNLAYKENYKLSEYVSKYSTLMYKNHCDI